MKKSEDMMTEYIIHTEGVKRVFSLPDGTDFIALHDVNIAIPTKTLTILKGRSGSGKTTLMNMLGALDRPSEGKIHFEQSDITKMTEPERERLRRNRIGFVFQAVALIPVMTAYENVEFALRLAGVKGDLKSRTEECLRMVGLGSRMNHMPQEMSGGEQQRVAIARAIVHKPAVIFADEPTGELDSQTGLQVMKIFKSLIEQEGITVVITTHDPKMMELGDIVYEITDSTAVKR